MNDTIRDMFRKPAFRRWGLYVLKAAVLLGAFCVLAQLAPAMPSAGVAVFWAALSVISAVGFTYGSVARKMHRATALEPDRLFARVNSGRTLALVVGFVLGAVCSAGLVLEAPKWDGAVWALVALSIPLYLAASLFAERFVGRQFARFLRTANVIRWSRILTGVLLCALYAAVCLALPAADYSSAAQAFTETRHPFENSPSTLMSEAGLLTSLVDGLTAYGMSEAHHMLLPVYLAVRIALVASAFFGIANLLTTCSLDRNELRKVFAPVRATAAEHTHARSRKRYLALAAALPVCLAVAFVAVDWQASKAAQTSEFTAAENFVRSQAGMAVYVLDGKYYDQQDVQGLIDETRQASESLRAEARETLVPLINASFDARLENVDGYLDWYYSIPADYERLARLVTGSAEQFVADQFQAKIEEGVDDTQLDEQLGSFLQQADQLENEAMAKLAGMEVDDVPEWLVTSEEPLDLSEAFSPTSEMTDTAVRMGISAGVGVSAGFLAKKVVDKAVQKEFAKKLVSKLGSTLGSRAAGSAIGGAVGTVGGPLGTIAGIVAGTAIGVGVDAVMLNIDEAQNRETYRQQIVDTIEQERSEMLALVE